MLRHCTDPRERLAVVGAIGVYVLANRGSNVLPSSKHWVCRPVWGVGPKVWRLRPSLVLDVLDECLWGGGECCDGAGGDLGYAKDESYVADESSVV